MRRYVLITVLLLPLSTLLAACGFVGTAANDDKPDGFPFRGYVSVAGAVEGVVGSPCLAPSGVPDITAGARVQAADVVTGTVVASTTLGAGVLGRGEQGFRCNFPYELVGLSGGRSAYLILVGEQPPVSFDTREVREGRPAIVNVTAGPSRPPSGSVRASTSPS